MGVFHSAPASHACHAADQAAWHAQGWRLPCPSSAGRRRGTRPARCPRCARPRSWRRTSARSSPPGRGGRRLFNRQQGWMVNQPAWLRCVLVPARYTPAVTALHCLKPQHTVPPCARVVQWVSYGVLHPHIHAPQQRSCPCPVGWVQGRRQWRLNLCPAWYAIDRAA